MKLGRKYKFPLFSRLNNLIIKETFGRLGDRLSTPFVFHSAFLAFFPFVVCGFFSLYHVQMNFSAGI